VRYVTGRDIDFRNSAVRVTAKPLSGSGLAYQAPHISDFVLSGQRANTSVPPGRKECEGPPELGPKVAKIF